MGRLERRQHILRENPLITLIAGKSTNTIVRVVFTPVKAADALGTLCRQHAEIDHIVQSF